MGLCRVTRLDSWTSQLACAASRQIERSEALLYGSDAIEFMLRDIENRHAEFILVLCFIVPLNFVLVLIALSRGRRLRKRVDVANIRRGTNRLELLGREG